MEKINVNGLESNVYMMYNFVYNSKFRMYSNELFSNHPDGYIFTGDAYFEANGGCFFGYNGDIQPTLTQHISESVNFMKMVKGKKLTFGVKLTQGVNLGGNIILTFSDGINTVNKNIPNDQNLEETIESLSLTVGENSNDIYFSISLDTDHTDIYINEVTVNIGDEPMFNLPPYIIDGTIGQDYSTLVMDGFPEFILEYDGTEIPANMTRLESVLSGKFGRGVNGRSKLPDARGRVMRIWAHGSPADPDRLSRINRGDGVSGDKVGTLQNCMNLLHSHSNAPHGHTIVSPAYDGGGNYMVGTGHYGSGVGGYCGNIAASSITIYSDGGSETRMININNLAGMRWC